MQKFVKISEKTLQILGETWNKVRVCFVKDFEKESLKNFQNLNEMLKKVVNFVEETEIRCIRSILLTILWNLRNILTV